MPSALTNIILHRRDTERTRSHPFLFYFSSIPIQCRYTSNIHPPNHSPFQRTPRNNTTINKTISRFNSIQFDSIRFDSIRFDSNLSNPFGFHTVKSVEIGLPQTSLQYLHSAASIVAALQTIKLVQAIQSLQIIQSLQTLQAIQAIHTNTHRAFHRV